MHKKPSKSRGSFSSSFGFIVSAAGSAIGLGNLWKFPYMAGSHGGGIFLISYLIFAVLLGVPLLLAETSLGRKSQLSAIGAFKVLNKKWEIAGILGVVCSFIILCYYSVVGGWILKYCWEYMKGAKFGYNKQQFFDNFIKSPVEPIFWHVLFILICAIIIICGVEKGIEATSKIMIPCLFILMTVIAIYGCSLNGAMEGIKFLFFPRFDAINSIHDIGSLFLSSMGQVFFSLSLGFGVMITYGSYLKKDTDLSQNTIIVAILGTIVAIFAGIAIFPAIFALGYEPAAGPGLIFGVLPAVFESMPFGIVLGFTFFVLVFIAAATSAMGLLEVISATLIDMFSWKRKTATIVMSSVAAFVGMFASLSMGVLSDIRIFNMNIFNVMVYLSDKILIPIGSILVCIFIGYVLKPDQICDEIERGTSNKFKFRKSFSIIMKFVAPILILIIFIMGVFS